jgi:hypothetical protein
MNVRMIAGVDIAGAALHNLLLYIYFQMKSCMP